MFNVFGNDYIRQEGSSTAQEPGVQELPRPGSPGWVPGQGEQLDGRELGYIPHSDTGSLEQRRDNSLHLLFSAP